MTVDIESGEPLELLAAASRQNRELAGMRNGWIAAAMHVARHMRGRRSIGCEHVAAIDAGRAAMGLRQHLLDCTRDAEERDATFEEGGDGDLVGGIEGDAGVPGRIRRPRRRGGGRGSGRSRAGRSRAG